MTPSQSGEINGWRLLWKAPRALGVEKPANEEPRRRRFLAWVVRHPSWPCGRNLQLVDLTGVFRVVGECAGRKAVRGCMSKRETRPTLAASPVQTEQTSEASGEEKPSETGRKWVAPPPTALASRVRG